MAKKVVIAVVVVVVVVVIIAKAFANPLEYGRPQQKIFSEKHFSPIESNEIASSFSKTPIRIQALIGLNLKREIRDEIQNDISRIFPFKTDARIAQFDPLRLSNGYGSIYRCPNAIQ